MSTLIDILSERKASISKGITFIDSNNKETVLSYKELYNKAQKVLFVLQEEGVQPKNELVLQVDDNYTFVVVFWACILGGIIPVPLSIGQKEEHKKKLFNVWDILNNPYILTTSGNLNSLDKFSENTKYRDVYNKISNNSVALDIIFEASKDGKLYAANENDIAFIQFSSGSTGLPKGVLLTHKNLIVNTKAIESAAKYTERDSSISWMPLTHDMGLIGFHINPMVSNMDQYIMPTNLFVRHPALWLDKASEYNVSILCSPNFGYNYVLNHCKGHYNWDLSSVRVLFNGAEPISEKLIEQFLDKMESYQLKRTAMCPVYGLAEASLAVSISNLDDEAKSVCIDRNHLKVSDKVILNDNINEGISFVNVGVAINDCAIRITDDNNKPVNDDIIGNIQIKGDNVTSGYYNDPLTTEKVIDNNNWLKTGDLGFIKDGKLYVTGRAKDIIFINGQNYYPHDLEALSETLSGIELNKVAFAGYFNSENQEEEVVAFVFHRGDLNNFIPVRSDLIKLINQEMGIALKKVIPVKDIPRTTSGKIQRFKLLEAYLNNEFNTNEEALNALLKTISIEIVEPKNEAEAQLLTIWKTIFENDNIGVTQPFFEIGGNSLKAAELVMLILKEFQVDIELETIYNKQTVRELILEINKATRTEYNSIPLVDIRESYNLSSSQKGIYYAWEIDRTSIAYNVPTVFKIRGILNQERLKTSIETLVSKHDALRMGYIMQSVPKFIINDTVAVNIKTITVENDELNETFKSLIKPFNLLQDQLFRVNIVVVNKGASYLFLDFHHSTIDGLSILYFMQDLYNLYQENKIENPKIQYKDFSQWDTEYSTSSKVVNQGNYWKHKLKGELSVLNFPTDFSRPQFLSRAGKKIEFSLEEKTNIQLRELAKNNNITLQVLLFSIYKLLLNKYTGQDDIIIGIPVSGRNHFDIRKSYGMFVNNVVIKNTINSNATFLDYLIEEKTNSLEALKNQEYPFNKLVETLDIKRDVSRSPIFDTMFMFQNMQNDIGNDTFKLSRHFFDPEFSKFDISMEVFDFQNTIVYGIEYSTDLFKEATILNVINSFKTLVNKVLENPTKKIKDISLLDSTTHKLLIHEFNRTEVSYSKNETITEVFNKQVLKTPNAIALEYDTIQLTYKELDEQATQIAAYLIGQNLSANAKIGVVLPRSIEFVVSIFGILKAGMCYIPIDVNTPGDRIRYCIENSKCSLIISSDALIEKLSFTQREIIVSIETLSKFQIENNKSELQTNTTVLDLAYVIYTSGTTGNPKGVKITHKSLLNYVNWATKVYLNTEADVFPLYSSVAFDLTLTSIFLPLLTGNKIVIYAEEVEGNTIIEDVINDNKSTIIKLTPSHLKIIKELSIKSNTVKTLIVGGEALTTQLCLDIIETIGNVTIYNEYGPTEATIGCMIYQFDTADKSQNVSLGKPIDNTQIYILDNVLQPVPYGVVGELYIAGDGLAEGYIYNKELTDLKFVDNPFITDTKMYRSGDLVKRNKDNSIVYLGRVDSQIKINGYRIELDEIQLQLLNIEAIEEAVVLVKDTTATKTIVAYCVASKALDTITVQKQLAGKIPTYMLPNNITIVDEIPLTNNGKVDTAKLLSLSIIKTTEYIESITIIEKQLLKVWETIFEDNTISITDGFFELGGDSIKAVQIVSALYNKGIELRVKDILTHQTIQRIAPFAEQEMMEVYEQSVLEGEKQFSPIEAWFFSQNFTNPNFYNQSVVLDIKKPINVLNLEKTFTYLIQSHDGLRLNLDAVQQKMYYNNTFLNVDFSIETHPISSIEDKCLELKQSFSITNTLLIKAAVFKGTSRIEKLFITIHHLVIDGVSWRILLNDLYTIYNKIENEEVLSAYNKTISLKSFQEHINAYLTKTNIEAQKKYWKAIEEVDFQLSTDFNNKSNNDSEKPRIFKSSLSVDNTQYLLKEANKSYKTTPEILLNTALVLALKNWTKKETIIIEQEGYGRELDHLNTANTVGWFTTMYPVKFSVQEKDTLENTIKHVKETINNIPDKGIGYGILKYLDKNSSLTKRERTPIRFNYLGVFNAEFNNDLFSYNTNYVGEESDIKNHSTAILECNIMIVDGKMEVTLHYNANDYEETTISTFINTFITQLKELLLFLKNETTEHFTVSDFDGAKLDEEDLNTILNIL
jgi:amino acid adenylation domain-containing protein/non-ribosomal peptide synthase protein (TIGR01720 family)